MSNFKKVLEVLQEDKKDDIKEIQKKIEFHQQGLANANYGNNILANNHRKILKKLYKELENLKNKI